jgi:hypothetical protein
LEEQHLIAELVEFDERERPGRVERMQEVNQILGDGAEGFWHSGGPEASWILSEAKDAYVYGFFVASLFASHAACERRLAGRVSVAAGRERPSGFDKWGLGGLIRWCSDNDWITADLAGRLYDLADKRNQLAHFRINFQPDDRATRRKRGPTVLERT